MAKPRKNYRKLIGELTGLDNARAGVILNYLKESGYCTTLDDYFVIKEDIEKKRAQWNREFVAHEADISLCQPRAIIGSGKPFEYYEKPEFHKEYPDNNPLIQFFANHPELDAFCTFITKYNNPDGLQGSIIPAIYYIFNPSNLKRLSDKYAITSYCKGTKMERVEVSHSFSGSEYKNRRVRNWVEIASLFNRTKQLVQGSELIKDFIKGTYNQEPSLESEIKSWLDAEYKVESIQIFLDQDPTSNTKACCQLQGIDISPYYKSLNPHSFLRNNIKEDLGFGPRKLSLDAPYFSTLGWKDADKIQILLAEESKKAGDLYSTISDRIGLAPRIS